VTKVKEFCLFYKKDGLPGRSQRRSLEQSATTTLGILGTLYCSGKATTHKVRGFKKLNQKIMVTL